MADKQTDVFGVGNAMVDILALVEDEFISRFGLEKGGMTLVDSKKQGGMLSDLEGITLEMKSGGSAANTMIAIAQSGGSGIYSGKVAADANGEFYRGDMENDGIEFHVAPKSESDPTGSCLVLTTPDTDRTMCTCLGASTSLHPEDIDIDRLATCKYSYVEGYLWDPPEPRKASIKTMQQSKKHGVKVSFTFSDPFLVDRFPGDFQSIVRDYCDVVFCNADEVKQFCQVEELSEAVSKLGKMVDLAFVTDGPNGCYVVANGDPKHVAGFQVKALDTVGAGDAFAGGTLYGLSNGFTPEESAKWGNYLAAQVVAIHGARLVGSQVQKRIEILGQ